MIGHHPKCRITRGYASIHFDCDGEYKAFKAGEEVQELDVPPCGDMPDVEDEDESHPNLGADESQIPVDSHE